MTIASIPKRLLAASIDFAIFLTLFLIIYLLFSFQYQTLEGQSGSGYTYGVVIPTSSIYLTILVSWTAFIVLTEFKTGQSIGKRLAKIKVVRQDFNKTTFFNTLIRHLFDTIDLILLLGLVIALTNKDRQRIGDLIAKTIVVTK
jgi:uncharacterized RDD family membrane protein YckC